MINDIKTPKELLNYMSQNITYGYLGKSGKVYYPSDEKFDDDWYSQYILETKDDVLKNKCGNCWDQVEFARDWFITHHYEIKTIYEMVLLDYDNIYPSHSFLVYKEDNTWNWFENADFNNRGIHKFNSLPELLNYQYKKYIEFLKTFNIKKEELDKIIITEFDKPKERISAKEYLDFVINAKRIIRNINIDEIHTTKLGEERIIKNLKLDNIDVIAYLKKKIMDKKATIYRKGKNFYCEIDNIRITINAYNYCIITAHVRKEKEND